MLSKSEWVHKYPTTCPGCNANLTKEFSVTVGFANGHRHLFEESSCLDADGVLQDVEGMITAGMHGSTTCGSCGENLDDHELF